MERLGLVRVAPCHWKRRFFLLLLHGAFVMKKVVRKELLVESLPVVSTIAYIRRKRQQIRGFPDIQTRNLQLVDHKVCLSIVQKLGSRVTHVKGYWWVVESSRQAKIFRV
jgi:hypothetical protein